MTDKITLPMDVSKGIQFDFTVEGITEGQAKNLLGLIQDEINNFGGVMAGGFVSVAHMEELELDRVGHWNDLSDVDLLDLVDDGISLGDIEDWENYNDEWEDFYPLGDEE